MDLTTDRSYLLNQQYQNAVNLDARIQLHLRFSTNSYGLYRWVFDQLALPLHARILELGCGSAKLWTENHERIPPHWDVTLSDFSPGMVTQAKQNLADSGLDFRFKQVDAQSISFDNASFDGVIANHMLYHVPDLPKALGEIQRVLKPNGYLFAATNGDSHLRELDDLLKDFDSRMGFVDQTALKFTLENGEQQLKSYFSRVDISYYKDSLIVTEVKPLIAYAFSMMKSAQLDDESKAKFSQHVNEKLRQGNGQIRIGKNPGMFIAKR